MKATRLIIPLLAVFLASCAEGDRSGANLPKLNTQAGIEPDKTIYGIPLGTTKDTFIKVCGEPSGSLRLRSSDSALVYGASHAFLFCDDQLIGIQLGNLMGWPLSSLVASNRFDGVQWRLANGITNGTTMTTLKAIMGDKLLGTDMSPDVWGHKYFVIGRSRVDLEFINRVDLSGDDAYQVFGVQITR